MIELAVFDMAGTTVDDHGIVYVALQDAVEETGPRLLRRLPGSVKSWPNATPQHRPWPCPAFPRPLPRCVRGASRLP